MKVKGKCKNYHIITESGASSIEAGYGLLHNNSIVATVDDYLYEDTSGSQIRLRTDKNISHGRISDLRLIPGTYNAIIEIMEMNDSVISQEIKLYIIDSSSISRKFGARYGALKYDLPVIIGKNKTAEWNNIWKTNDISDIIVDFNARYKFVFWKGMAYAPSWFMDNVMTSLFFAETLDIGSFRDCCEMMSDRECRYSHVRVIHNSDARVVVHWRYALCDSAYNINRDQWADEMFYIYPDGIAIRSVTVYLDPQDEDIWQISPQNGRIIPCSMLDKTTGKKTYNDLEFITVNPAGTDSDDNICTGALTLMDCENFSKTFSWPDPPVFQDYRPPALNEYIYRINYLYRDDVFAASYGEGMKMSLQQSYKGMVYEAGARVQDDNWSLVDISTKFPDYIHWPVTRGYGTTALTDNSVYNERPTHTFLGHACNEPFEVRKNGETTWVWICGMATEGEGSVRERVNSWSSPVDVNCARYDKIQGAYITNTDNNSNSLEIMTGENGIITHPVFILNGLSRKIMGIRINRRELEEGQFITGIENHISGVRTVAVIKEKIPPSSTIFLTFQEE